MVVWSSSSDTEPALSLTMASFDQVSLSQLLQRGVMKDYIPTKALSRGIIRRVDSGVLAKLICRILVEGAEHPGVYAPGRRLALHSRTISRLPRPQAGSQDQHG